MCITWNKKKTLAENMLWDERLKNRDNLFERIKYYAYIPVRFWINLTELRSLSLSNWTT